MLGKDDAFKVVLDPARDPGADKRGLLGPARSSTHVRTPEEPEQYVTEASKWGTTQQTQEFCSCYFHLTLKPQRTHFGLLSFRLVFS